MRTTAEAQRARAARSGGTAAARRGRGAPAPARGHAAAATAPPSSAAAAQAVAVSTVRMLRVEEGLYALRVGEIAGERGDIAGMAVPVAQVAAPFVEDGSGVEIVASFPHKGPWLDKNGGTVILRSPVGGGQIIVTVYGGAEAAASDLAVELRRLDGPPGVAGGEAPAAMAAAPAGEERDVPTEILLHIERAGDRLFPGRGWVGALGRRMRIEALSIRPLERLAPADLEMKGYLPNGGETPWVPGGVLCGTRGRGLPLTGFAVRIVPQRADRFEVLYQGSFFAGGISPMQHNGAPCRAASGDDPLEAIHLRLVERGGPADSDAA